MRNIRIIFTVCGLLLLFATYGAARDYTITQKTGNITAVPVSTTHVSLVISSDNPEEAIRVISFAKNLQAQGIDTTILMEGSGVLLATSKPKRKVLTTQKRPYRPKPRPSQDPRRPRRPIGRKKLAPSSSWPATSLGDELVSFKRKSPANFSTLQELTLRDRQVTSTDFGRFNPQRRALTSEERRRAEAAAAPISPFNQSPRQAIAAELISFDGNISACPRCMNAFGIQNADLIPNVSSQKTSKIRAVHVEHNNL